MNVLKAIFCSICLLTASASSALAQTIPSSLNSIFRTNKLELRFSSAERIRSSHHDIITPYKGSNDFYASPEFDFEIPSDPDNKATVSVRREFSVDNYIYCRNLPVDYIEIRRYNPSSNGGDWGTINSRWQSKASATKPCPSVAISTNVSNAPMVNYPGLVRVSMTGRRGWEAVIRYKTGKVLTLRFAAEGS